MVSEVVPDRASRHFSPFRERRSQSRGRAFRGDRTVALAFGQGRAHLARNTCSGYWREAGLSLFLFAAGGGRGALGSLPSSSVLSGLGRAQGAASARLAPFPSFSLGGSVAPTRTVNEVQAPRVASATANPATAGQPPPPGVSGPPGLSVAAPLAQPALVASAPAALPEWFPSFWSDGPPPVKKARAIPFAFGEALTPVPGGWSTRFSTVSLSTSPNFCRITSSYDDARPSGVSQRAGSLPARRCGV